MNSLEMPPNLTGIAKSSRMAQTPGAVPLMMPQRRAMAHGANAPSNVPETFSQQAPHAPQQFDMASEPSVLSDGGEGLHQNQYSVDQAQPVSAHDVMQTPVGQRPLSPGFAPTGMQDPGNAREAPVPAAKDRGRSMLVNGAIAVLVGAVAYNMPFHIQSYMNVVSRNGQYDEFRNRSYAVALAGVCFLLAEVFNG